MNNQQKTILLKRDTQIKVLLRRTIRSHRGNWYGIWMLCLHGIWKGLNVGISEMTLDLGGKVGPVRTAQTGPLLLC